MDPRPRRMLAAPERSSRGSQTAVSEVERAPRGCVDGVRLDADGAFRTRMADDASPNSNCDYDTFAQCARDDRGDRAPMVRRWCADGAPMEGEHRERSGRR